MIYLYICQSKRLILTAKYSFCFKYTLKRMLIIGIAGGTGSGKTTVVRKIIESYRLVKWYCCHKTLTIGQ